MNIRTTAGYIASGLFLLLFSAACVCSPPDSGKPVVDGGKPEQQVQAPAQQQVLVESEGGEEIIEDGGSVDMGGQEVVVEDGGSVDMGGQEVVVEDGGSVDMGGQEVVVEDGGSADMGGQEVVVEDGGSADMGSVEVIEEGEVMEGTETVVEEVPVGGEEAGEGEAVIIE